MKLKTLSLASLAAFSLIACGGGDKPATENTAANAPAAPAAAEGESIVVKIAYSGPLSGPIAHIGKDAEHGVAVAIDEANAAGITLGGKKATFELVSEDDQSDPKTATQVAQRFVDNQVAGVIGHITSGATVPASKIYADNNLPHVSPSSTSPTFTSQGYATSFRLIADDSQQGQALATFATKDLGAKNIAVIDDRTAYGQGLADEFANAATQLGATIVKREFTTDKSTDFAAILTSIKATNPELIFFGGMDAQSGPMAKQMQKLGIEAKFMSGDGMQTETFLRLAADAAEGKYASLAGSPKDQQPGYASFAEKLKAKFNEDVQLYATYAYDSANVLIDAIKRADSADPKVYLPKLKETAYEGATGKITFDDKGNRSAAAVTIYQVNKGQWEVVKVVAGQ